MAFSDNLRSLDLQAPLVPLALVETSLLRCLMVTMKNLAALVFLFLAQWVQLVPVVFLAPLALLAPKVSKVPLVNLVSLVLLVQWVLVVQPVHLARMEMMVKLENLAVPVSVVLLAHRVPVAFLELLASQA